jgi:macrolide transport system ATP-binding/permease protein
LTIADVEAIRREATSVAQVSYMIRQSGQVQFGDQNWTTSIQAVTASYPPITNWRIEQGRGLTDNDVAGAALVIVLGQTVYRQLFPEGDNPIGAVVLVKGIPLRVIGLYVSKGQSGMGQDQDDVVMIPFTTGERKIVGVAAPSLETTVNPLYPALPNPYGIAPRLTGFVNAIFVQASSASAVQKAIDEVTDILNDRHRIRPGATADFNVRNLTEMLAAQEESSRVMTLLLAAVAGVSLVVGGIGIMNIMLVSVTERTREIGLRMAVGARGRDILGQFLIEAVTLSLMGGAIGVLLGAAATWSVGTFAGWQVALSSQAVALAVGFSAAVGVFFGFYPARRAAALLPIQALRYE